MYQLALGSIVAVATFGALFFGNSVAASPLLVAAGFIIVFDRVTALSLAPEICFGKFNNSSLMSILMFIVFCAAIASTHASADLHDA